MLFSGFCSSICTFLVNVAGKDMLNFILFFPSVTINLDRFWKRNWEMQREKINKKMKEREDRKDAYFREIIKVHILHLLVV